MLFDNPGQLESVAARSRNFRKRSSLSVTIHWKAVEQYFTVGLFVFAGFGKFINFGFGTVRSERDNTLFGLMVVNRISM